MSELFLRISETLTVPAIVGMVSEMALSDKILEAASFHHVWTALIVCAIFFFMAHRIGTSGGYQGRIE